MRSILPYALLSGALSLFLAGCARPLPPDRPPVAEVKAQEALWEAPPVVSPGERMPSAPSPGEYVAFSLRVAQQRITDVGAGGDYRTVAPEVYQLGGITQFVGLVYEPHRHELILVGRYRPDRQPLTLDDFAVALRARFVHEHWPIVSIDSTEDTPETGLQRVRFEGGIAETQFGADLLDADYRLKQIGLGLLPASIPGFKTHWDRRRAWSQEPPVRAAIEETGGESWSMTSRFWFYPVLQSVAVRQNVVSIKGLKIGRAHV